jgi:hypothetical protein
VSGRYWGYWEETEKTRLKTDKDFFSVAAGIVRNTKLIAIVAGGEGNIRDAREGKYLISPLLMKTLPFA